MRDGMLDLETWGLRVGSAIRSVAMVQFDPYSDRVGAKFYANVTLESCQGIGLEVDPKTRDWWDKQSVEAQSVLTKDPVPIGEAVSKLVAFWRMAGLTYPWSQGANFDQPLIEEIMRRLGVPIPWKFYDSACTRTAYRMSGFNVFGVKRQGIPHYALDDCLHQIVCVQKSYSKLGLRN